MAQQNLDFGTAAANDGETLFDGFTKVQANFAELYGYLAPLSSAQGGTGVANNAASTITISGNFATTLTVTNTTGVTLPVSGTLATLAGTEELTGKTLTSSVGKGTWTASGTWTLPAITLGGTVSGGGQQLNNIIIGTSTPLAGTFTTLTATTATITQGTITDPATMLSGTVTWNDAADTFTAWKLNVTDTNSAADSKLVDWQVGSNTITHIRKSGIVAFPASGSDNYAAIGVGNWFGTLGVFTAGGITYTFGATSLGIVSGASISWNSDLFVHRDAANTLALRNSTNAQTFNLYNTYTDASNFENVILRYAGNQAQLITNAAGTGTARQLAFGIQGAQLVFTNGSTMTATSHLAFTADATYDIGAHVATRPKNCWLAGALARAAPVTETNSTHTLAATTTHLICNRAGDVTVTLPTASSFTGREIYIKTIQAQTVTSNASDVVPSTSATAGTAICPATDGAWAFLVSDGTNWIIMAANPLV